MKFLPVGAEFSVQTDGQTDKTKPAAACRNYAKAPNDLNQANDKISDEVFVG